MTKLLPFNLEKAIAGEKVVTRDGREVVFIAQEKKTHSDTGLFFVVKDNDSYDSGTCNQAGHFFGDADPEESEWDLFMAPKVTTYWANVYRLSDGRIIVGDGYKSEREALCDVNKEHIVKTISFEIEEPEVTAGQPGTSGPLKPYLTY